MDESFNSSCIAESDADDVRAYRQRAKEVLFFFNENEASKDVSIDLKLRGKGEQLDTVQ